MKKIIFFITALFLVSLGISAQDALNQAEEAYKNGDFNTAIEQYEAVLKDKGASATVYFNLGNSYFKTNRLAQSILNYERAVLLDPGNKDFNYNLELARSRTVDKIEPLGDFFLATAFNWVRNLLSVGSWTVVGIVGFLLFIGCLFVFFFSRKVFLKKTGFYVGIVLLVVVIFANVFAYSEKKQLEIRNTAIIFSPSTTIKSSPDGADQFILHEGTKVTIGRKVGEWTEIETADGNVGWIRNNEMEVI